jgi:hypothetical protein
MREPPTTRAGATRCAIEDLVDALQVLALSIDASERDPVHRWHQIDMPFLVKRVLVTAATVSTLLTESLSESGSRHLT